MAPNFRARVLPFITFIIGSIFLICTLCSIYNTIENSRSINQARDRYSEVRNETLGFEKVFVINLPSRPDKRDNIVLGSSLSGFRVDWIDGVDPKEISPKSLPYNWNHAHLPTEYARRRAHLNGIQQIIEQRLGSAIIMEDDADWDVSIKTQLQNFAIALRQLQGNTELISTSPFGDGWDILWLGHCGLQCKPMLPAYLTPNDPTVPPSHHFLPYLREQPPFERPENGRLTCAAHDIACGSFYAVSYRGAQKILAALSVIPLGLAEEIDIGDQVDTSLGRLCGHGYLKCYATYPALTGKFRAAGANGKVSDVHNRTGIAKGFASWGVMYSMMLNIQQVMKGKVTALATWDDVNVPDTKNLRMDSVSRSYMRVEEEILLQEGTILQEVMYNSGVPKREDI